jgi:DNA-binding PadR family transcriptional regulator
LTKSENKQQPVEALLPLREPTFYILLSLVPGEKHGYAILKDVESLSRGDVRLSTSTLYEGLARLLEQGLIARLNVGEDVADDSIDGEAVERAGHPGRPRKAYRITSYGRRVVEAETSRMQALVTAAHTRLGKAAAM